jgi:hypothetical protein
MSKKRKGYPDPCKIIRATLYEKYFKCKDRKCPCQKGKQIHGPHYYLSYSTDTHSRNVYIAPKDVKTAKEYVNNYIKLWDFIKRKSLENIKNLQDKKTK